MGTQTKHRVNMPHSFGIRAGTRDLYSRPYRARGTIAVTTYLTQFKVGEMIDIKTNSAVHKGMPHKFYHGRTGIIYNVTKRGLGVIVNKTVGHRILKKRTPIMPKAGKTVKSKGKSIETIEPAPYE